MSEWTSEDEEELKKVESDLKRQAFWSKHSEKIVYALYAVATLGLVILVYQTFN